MLPEVPAGHPRSVEIRAQQGLRDGVAYQSGLNRRSDCGNVGAGAASAPRRGSGMDAPGHPAGEEQRRHHVMESLPTVEELETEPRTHRVKTGHEAVASPEKT